MQGLPTGVPCALRSSLPRRNILAESRYQNAFDGANRGVVIPPGNWALPLPPALLHEWVDASDGEHLSGPLLESTGFSFGIRGPDCGVPRAPSTRCLGLRRDGAMAVPCSGNCQWLHGPQ